MNADSSVSTIRVQLHSSAVPSFEQQAGRWHALPRVPDRCKRCLHAVRHLQASKTLVGQRGTQLLGRLSAIEGRRSRDLMSGTHQRTWQQYHVGHLLITVQLDSAATGQKLERHQDLAGVTRRLISLAASERLPITWAVSDPAHSAATSLILQSAIEHELAILGDATWVGATAGRTRFARELIRRLAQARAIGLDVTSLVPHVASIENQIDLVVKQHITAVAGFESPESERRLLSPRALHYGVWEVPISEDLPLQSGRFFNGKR